VRSGHRQAGLQRARLSSGRCVLVARVGLSGDRADGVQDGDEGLADGFGGGAGGEGPQACAFERQVGGAGIRMDRDGGGIWPVGWFFDGEDGHVADAGQAGADAVARDAIRDGSQLRGCLLGRCCLREVCAGHVRASGQVSGARCLSG